MQHRCLGTMPIVAAPCVCASAADAPAAVRQDASADDVKEKNYIEAEAAYKRAMSIGRFGHRKEQVPAKLVEVPALAEAQRAASR